MNWRTTVYCCIITLLGFNGWSQSPGGVSGDLTLWLDANAGITESSGAITGWLDQSSTGITVTQVTAANQPRIDGELQNYYYCPTFDGNDRLAATCSPSSFYATGPDSPNTTSTGSIFVVGRMEGNDQHIVSQFPEPICGNYVFQCVRDGSGNLNTGGKSSTDNAFNYTETTPFLSSSTETTGTNTAIHYLNGGVGNVASTLSRRSCASDQVLRIGPALVGNIAEVITYDVQLTTAQKLRVESYLAIKYGITLDNSGGGTYGDYITSTDLTVWDATVSPSYHNQVIGIARDDASGLLQKQSHQYDDSTRIYVSTLAATNGANGGSIASDLSAVMLGNDQGQLCATSGSSSEIPVSPYIFSRLEREWKVTNTAFNQDFNFDVRLNDCAQTSMVNVADLILLVDDDGDFTDAQAYTSADGLSISYNSGVVTIGAISTSMIPQNATRYMTIASTNAFTPLPLVMTDFQVRADRRKTEIRWEMASEDGLDYYEVQRLENETAVWKSLESVKATNSRNYTTYDEVPESGYNYYRVAMINFDGNSDYSPVQYALHESAADDILVFPNPASDRIHIRSSSPLQTVLITDPSGRVVSLVSPDVEGSYEQTIATDGFTNGLYLVHCNGMTKRIVIRH